jgi:hypothetical protein
MRKVATPPTATERAVKHHGSEMPLDFHPFPSLPYLHSFVYGVCVAKF